MHGTSSIIFFLLRLVLCLIIWSVLEKVSWLAEKKIYSIVLGWNGLYISVKSIHLLTYVSFTMSLFSFCLSDLYLGENEVLKSPNTIFSSSKYVLSVNNITFTNMGALVFGTLMINIERLFWWIFSLMRMKCLSFPISLITFCRKSILLDIRMQYPACILGPLVWNFFPAFYSERVLSFATEVCFLNATKCWVLFTYPVCWSMPFY